MIHETLNTRALYCDNFIGLTFYLFFCLPPKPPLIDFLICLKRSRSNITAIQQGQWGGGR